MAKAIVILSGCNDGKNKFNDLAMHTYKYWVWNINPRNKLQAAARIVGWDGENRDENYYNFANELFDIANKYWDFKNKYILEMIEKFKNDHIATLLVVHNCPQELIPTIKEEHNGFTFHIVNQPPQSENVEFDKTLVFSENGEFDTEVGKALAAITRD